MATVVDTAKQYVGKVSYQFGANNVPGGIADCSSFVQYVYAQHGIQIGRTTNAQLTSGLVTRVSQDQLQPGDLVFFKNTYNSGYTDGVSHVGIYIGNGQFVENNSSKGVTVSNLSDSYYQNHWLTGGRVSGVGTIGGTVTPVSTGLKDKFFDWLGLNEIMKNVGVILLIVLCAIIGIVLFLGAWDIDVMEALPI